MIKRIVILGGGFGGLNAAMRLGRALKRGTIEDYEIVLVDKNDYHTYTPTLYEAATTSKDVADFLDLKRIVTFPIDRILKRLPVKFVVDEVESIDMGAHEDEVHLKSGYNLRYDYLVNALGSVTNDFGIPGIKEFGYSFKTFSDALRIRDTVWAEMSKEGDNEKPLEIVVGGGGSTGVELAGELSLWLHQLTKKHGRRANVTICEGSPTILPGFNEKIISLVSKRLEKLGVKVVNGKMIQSVNADKTLNLNDGSKLNADIFVWAGGVKANQVATNMPLKAKKGRTEVMQSMLCLPENPDLTFGSNVFGIGDVVCANNPATGNPVPMVARAALSEAKVAATNIINDIKGWPHIDYKPMDYPYVVPVGGKYAVAKIGKFIIAGFWGWILKLLVELNYLISIMPFWRAVGLWLHGVRIFIQNDRLG